jgi:hypothetical protein
VNRNEKILAAAAGAVLLVVIGYLFVARAVLGPADAQTRIAADLELQIQKVQGENAQDPYLRKRLAEFAGRTFDTDENRASEAVRTHLVTLIQRSGLGSSELSLKPFNGTPEPGVYREIGWFMRARGKLDRVVNLLYLISEDAYIHRIESLIVSPVARSLDVDVQARYSTLVLLRPAAIAAEAMETNKVTGALEKVQLDGPSRQRYDVIAERDLFRPYVKRRERPVTGTPGEVASGRPSEQPSQLPPSAPEWARLRVVGLPSWGDREDIFLSDGVTSRVYRYNPGDELAGGTIVMVDYRLMPMPGKPDVLSGSRVILRIGPDVWVVELGQTLAEKRVMRHNELPPELRVQAPAAPQPAPEAAPQAAPTGPAGQANAVSKTGTP